MEQARPKRRIPPTLNERPAGLARFARNAADESFVVILFFADGRRVPLLVSPPFVPPVLGVTPMASLRVSGSGARKIDLF